MATHDTHANPSANQPSGMPSRRAFMKGGAASLAMLALGSMVGCAKGSEGGATADDIKWDEEFDIVIVGAGAAGMAAAVTVATEGDGVRCLLAEKGEHPNGNSPYAKGTVVYTDDEEGFFEYMKEMAGEHCTTPEAVLRAYAHGATENLEWVLKHGAPKEEMKIIAPGGKDKPLASDPEYPEFEHGYALGKFTLGANKDVEIKGPKHITIWMNSILEQHKDKVEYRKSAPLTDLIQDCKTKEILGAVIGDKKIRAKRGVIMTCGGFESNPTMMEDYIGQGAARPAAGKLNTGDGHKACMRVGADFWHMEHCAGFWMAGRDLENKEFTDQQIVSPCPKEFGITVGLNGRRFYMDWDGYSSRDKYEYRSNIHLTQGSRHGHQNFGGHWPHLPMPPQAWFVFDEAGKEAGAIVGEAGKDPVGNKLAHSAQTIEELADKMGVPKDELVKTVERYNECCDKGEDIFFWRPSKTLHRIDKPPYYAQIVIPAFLNTDGGPVRNENGQILDTKGEPIKGLYSAGEFGSVWGGVYQGGGNVGECLIFGRISARNALKNT